MNNPKYPSSFVPTQGQLDRLKITLSESSIKALNFNIKHMEDNVENIHKALESETDPEKIAYFKFSLSEHEFSLKHYRAERNRRSHKL